MDITRLDPIEQLTFDASHPVSGAFPMAILGDVKTRDFELIPVSDISPDLQQRIVADCLVFVGVVGLVNGTPKSALQVPLDNVAIAAVSAAYISAVEAGLNGRLEIDELHRLWAKPTGHNT